MEHEYGPARVQERDALQPILAGSIAFARHTDRAAAAHLLEAGLDGVVSLHLGDARQVLRSIEPEKPFDFVFIDAVKEQSFEYLDAVRPKLARRSILVTDNTLTHADELASFVEHLRHWPGATSCQVPVGNGFELTVV